MVKPESFANWQGKQSMSTEAAQSADFSRIRYAQCWEDADILLSGLAITPSDTCLAIASAGDNALAMLGAGAKRVIALDLNPAQLSCLALRVAAYRTLEHDELLALMGSRPSDQRQALYQRCRSALTAEARQFWDVQPALIAAGIGAAGKFEEYFRLFRQRVLPLVHGKQAVNQLLQGGERQTREQFYNQVWDNRRWRWLFQLFFSRRVMGLLGRSPAFFKYVEGSVAERILNRTRYALTELDPADNPYLHWILTGTHGQALPWVLREENFDQIRQNLDKLEWHCLTIEAFLAREPELVVDKWNLSDIFEYMSPDNYHTLLQQIVSASAPEGRLAYWNMLAPRSRPPSMSHQLQPLTELAQSLFAQDKAFFYSAFIVEQVLPQRG